MGQAGAINGPLRDDLRLRAAVLSVDNTALGPDLPDKFRRGPHDYLHLPADHLFHYAWIRVDVV